MRQIKKILLIPMVVTVFMLVLGNISQATIISSYDIDNAVQSGWGDWAHFYTGTVTQDGPVDGGFYDGAYGTQADYTGGGGILNDDQLGDSRHTTPLFATLLEPTITLYLDGTYFLSELTLYSFDDANTIPGNITGLDITIGGVSETFLTTTS